MLQGGLERSPTGFTGLINQGATCYLNSLLQTLFMLPEFRSAMYAWTYDAEARTAVPEERCLSRQLQRLFAQLQLSARAAVTTGSLTKSFGWSGSEAFVQQDVQECMSVIFRFLQEQSLKDHIGSMHEGRVYDFLECHNCHQRRGRLEMFRDLQLDVRNMGCIEDSLRAFVAGESLEGVECPQCGKQDHLKGLALRRFPYFLTLQLKRFDLDFSTWQRVKLTNPIRIPLVLNVTEFTSAAEGEGGGEVDGDGAAPEYELLSVFMHIGSAMAGHYFAYIKDVSTGAWLNFNDSTVTPMTVDEIRANLGCAAPLEPGSSPPSGSAPPPKSAASNAYMLVYRRSTGGNVSSVPDSLVPPDLAAEIALENAKFAELKAEWEEERKWVNVTVYHDSAAKGLRIHEDKRISDLKAMAVDAFSLQGIGADRIRLRRFDPLKGIALEPMHGEDVALRDLPDEQLRKPMTLELRAPGADFEVYLQDGLPIVAQCFVSAEQAFTDSKTVLVPKNGVVGDLRTACARTRSIAPDQVSLVHFNGDHPRLLLDDSVALQGLKLAPGDTIHFECEPADAQESSALAGYFERLVHTATISFNDPGHDPQTSPYDAASGVSFAATDQRDLLHASIDVREPLARLKELIAQALGRDQSLFKIRRTAGGIELKDLDASVAAHGLDDGSRVHIKLGKPMVPGEYQFLAKLVPSLDAPAIPLGPLVLHEAMTTEDVKHAVIRTFSDAHDLPEPSMMRLRQASSTGSPGGVKMGDVVVDGVSLLAAYGDKLLDGKVIALQKILLPETFTAGDMLLRVRCWDPDTQTLTSPTEVVVPKEATTFELKQRLSSFSSTLAAPAECIPVAHVAVSKPFAYLLKDTSNIVRLKWKPQPLDDRSISGAPLRFKPGDLVLFMDARKIQTPPPPSEGAAAGPGFTPHASGEQGFVIYSAEEVRPTAPRCCWSWCARDLAGMRAAALALALHLPLPRVAYLFCLLPPQQVQREQAKKRQAELDAEEAGATTGQLG